MHLGNFWEYKAINMDIISGKYFNIWEGNDFPLTLGNNWQPLTEQHFNTPTGTSIYALSGYGVLYIGSNKGGNRPYEHKSDFKRNAHDNQYMQNVVNKHGLSGMFYQPILEIPAEFVADRDSIENSYIRHFDTFRNGYNLAEFASTPLLGRKVSDETKSKISKAKKGKKIKPFTEETKKRMSLAQSNRTPEHILNRNLAINKASEKFYRKEWVTNMRTGETLLTNMGLNNFVRLHNLSLGNFHCMIKGKVKSCKGWRLATPEEIDNASRLLK